MPPLQSVASRVALTLAIVVGVVGCGGGPDESAGEPSTPASIVGGDDGGPVPALPEPLPTSAGPGDPSAEESSTTSAGGPFTTSSLVAPVGSPATCGLVEPVELGFDRFYTQHCDAVGVAVLASAEVDPAAVAAAADVVVAMIGHRSDLIDAMVAADVRLGVIGRQQVTSDMPEYRDIYEQFPGTDWDTRARGLGATSFIPLSSVGEENLLCEPDDVYRGESILVHEFAHTIHIMGLDPTDPGFSQRLRVLYEEAMEDGRWANTYAATNPEEYFAEAVQSYFNANQVGPEGGDGIHNDIDTRAELAAYDPAVHDLIAEVFRPDPLPICQTGR